MDAGMITGFKFDNRIFIDLDKVKEALEIFAQMSKSNLFDEQKDEKVEKEKAKSEDTETVSSNPPKNIPSKVLEAVCSRCRKTKPVVDFSKSNKGKRGVQSYCISCQKEYLEERKKNRKAKEHKVVEKVVVESKQETSTPLPTKTLPRSPDNTALFLNWLAENNVKRFDVRDFVRAHPDITLDHAKDVVAHLIIKNKLQQLSKTEFKVV